MTELLTSIPMVYIYQQHRWKRYNLLKPLKNLNSVKLVELFRNLYELLHICENIHISHFFEFRFFLGIISVR